MAYFSDCQFVRDYAGRGTFKVSVSDEEYGLLKTYILPEDSLLCGWQYINHAIHSSGEAIHIMCFTPSGKKILEKIDLEEFSHLLN